MRDTGKVEEALKAIIRLITGLLTFSGREIIGVRAAIFLSGLRLGFGGLILAGQQLVFAICIRKPTLLIRRAVEIVASASPYGA